jgi:integrase
MLTAKKVERVKEPGRYFDGHGLYLQVVNANNKSWLLRFERDGRERWFGIGPVHTVTLKEARERARNARLLLLDGVDPIEHRKAQRAAVAAAKAKALTFREAAQAYFDQHESKWRNATHRHQFITTLKTYAFPVLGNMSVADIDTAAVLRAIEPHWLTKTETMNRTRGRIESVLDWATVRGYRSGDNPARWKGHLGEVLPARSQVAKPVHLAAMPYSELPSFMATLRKREGIAARALEFIILTAGRSGEVRGLRWDEIDPAGVWTVPADRMKGGREHRVPLSPRCIAILQEMEAMRQGDLVFPGQAGDAPLSGEAFAVVMRGLGRGGVTVHGFRSSFRDWCGEQTNFPREIAEAALAHAIESKVEAAYRRGDALAKRRRLMEAWEKFATSPPPVRAGATVTPIRERERA